MRIVILSNLYPPYVKGGHEYQCQFAAEVLAEKGHEVFVLTSRYGTDQPGFRRENRIFRRFLYYTEIRSLPRRLLAGLLNRANYFIAKRAIREIKPDLAYVGQLNGVSVYPLKALKQSGVPLVYHIGHYYFCELARYCVRETNPVKKKINQCLTGFRGLDEFDFSHMLAVSTAIKAAHVEAGYTAGNISVIPPLGISDRQIARQARPAVDLTRRQVRFLFVGRLSRIKGIHIALESLKRLRDSKEIPDFAFRIIGEGEENYTAQLKQALGDWGLQDRVSFEGFLPAEEVVRAYDSSDLLLVPSLEEPFGLIVIEAMARGLPVVASAVGGLMDIIAPGQNGMLFEPGNSQDLGQQVAKLVNDPEFYSSLSRQALATVRAKYSRAAVARQLADYLQNVNGAKA